MADRFRPFIVFDFNCSFYMLACTPVYMPKEKVQKNPYIISPRQISAKSFFLSNKYDSNECKLLLSSYEDARRAFIHRSANDIAHVLAISAHSELGQ